MPPKGLKLHWISLFRNYPSQKWFPSPRSVTSVLKSSCKDLAWFAMRIRLTIQDFLKVMHFDSTFSTGKSSQIDELLCVG